MTSHALGGGQPSGQDTEVGQNGVGRHAPAAQSQGCDPEPSDQQANRKRRGVKGGRPPQSDSQIYGWRNVVERSINLLIQWRRSTTRYDERSVVYRAGAVLAAVITWLRSRLGVETALTG